MAWPVARASKPLKASRPKTWPAGSRPRAPPILGRLRCKPGRFSMKLIRLISAAVLFVAASGPGFAADPIFPPGLRVGLTPLVGLVPAQGFAGFETEDQSVKVLVTELPAEAYGEVMNAFKANPAGTNGVKPENIETAAGLA